MQPKNRNRLAAILAGALLAVSMTASANSDQVFRWKIPGGGAPASSGVGGPVLAAAPAGQPFSAPPAPAAPAASITWKYDGLTVNSLPDASGNLNVTFHYSDSAGSGATQDAPYTITGSSYGTYLVDYIVSARGSTLRSTYQSATNNWCPASPEVAYTGVVLAGGDIQLNNPLVSPAHGFCVKNALASSFPVAVSFSPSGENWAYAETGAVVPTSFQTAVLDPSGVTGGGEGIPMQVVPTQDVAIWGSNMTIPDTQAVFVDAGGAPLQIPEALAVMGTL